LLTTNAVVPVGLLAAQKPSPGAPRSCWRCSRSWAATAWPAAHGSSQASLGRLPLVMGWCAWPTRVPAPAPLERAWLRRWPLLPDAAPPLAASCSAPNAAPRGGLPGRCAGPRASSTEQIQTGPCCRGCCRPPCRSSAGQQIPAQWLLLAQLRPAAAPAWERASLLPRASCCWQRAQPLRLLAAPNFLSAHTRTENAERTKRTEQARVKDKYESDQIKRPEGTRRIRPPFLIS